MDIIISPNAMILQIIKYIELSQNGDVDRETLQSVIEQYNKEQSNEESKI